MGEVLPCEYCLKYVKVKPNVESKIVILARRFGKASPENIIGVIAFDVDGVLDGYGGPITRNIIDTYRKNWFVGIISARGDHAEIKEKFSLDFSYRWNGNALKEAMNRFPDLERYVYVSDNLDRKSVAESLGWEFFHPARFKALWEFECRFLIPIIA